METTIIILFVLFQIKHLVFDFFLQGPYQYLNKGKYGHFGGIFHALLHAYGTMFVLYFAVSSVLPFQTALLLSLVDAVTHYHVDWAKVNVTRYFKLTPTTSEWFWHLVGIDQALHQLTYIGIIWYVVKVIQ